MRYAGKASGHTKLSTAAGQFRGACGDAGLRLNFRRLTLLNFRRPTLIARMTVAHLDGESHVGLPHLLKVEADGLQHGERPGGDADSDSCDQIASEGIDGHVRSVRVGAVQREADEYRQADDEDADGEEQKALRALYLQTALVEEGNLLLELGATGGVPHHLTLAELFGRFVNAVRQAFGFAVGAANQRGTGSDDGDEGRRDCQTVLRVQTHNMRFHS